ncbi:hypothetical protein [Kitasatospora sp. McL0602]|uniref:hypothetical protein n=1 Tax=Kitasatospora sp. McL0602 TaxID=3439530 RepID=UPI003F8C2177
MGSISARKGVAVAGALAVAGAAVRWVRCQLGAPVSLSGGGAGSDPKPVQGQPSAPVMQFGETPPPKH